VEKKRFVVITSNVACSIIKKKNVIKKASNSIVGMLFGQNKSWLYYIRLKSNNAFSS